MSPKVFKKNKEKLIEKIKEWTKSKETYTCRFGIEMLMSHFLDDDTHIDRLEAIECFKKARLSLEDMKQFFEYEKNI